MGKRKVGTRRKRSDRNHIVYKITNKKTGEFYIGVTAVTGRAFRRSAKLRFMKHVSRARCEEKDWALYEDMRKYRGSECEAYKWEVVRVVRGKEAVHQFEVELIDRLKPTLNTHKKSVI